MHKTQSLLGIALLVCACDAGAPPANRLRAPIVNGTTDSSHASVGELVHGNSLCSATLVGKKSVVTAGHCVKAGDTHYFILDGDWWNVAATHRHPDYDDVSTANDIALVILADAPPVKATPVSTKAPALGQVLTMVGYGKTGEKANDSETRRVGTNTIAELDATTITMYGSSGDQSNICNGDSGGPSFASFDGQPVQVGVHSLKLGDCGWGGVDTRVDAFVGWLSATSQGDLLEGPVQPQPPPPPPPPPPPVADADGDGVPDAEDLCSNTPAGQPVWKEGQWKGCAGGQSPDGAAPVLDSDGDGVPDGQDYCSNTPAGQKVWNEGEWRGCAGGQFKDQ